MTAGILGIVTAILAGVAALSAVVTAIAVARTRRGTESDRAAEAVRQAFAELRAELDQKAATQRLELTDALSKMGGGLDSRVAALTETVNRHFTAFAEIQQKTGENLAESQRARLNETNAVVGKLTETLREQQEAGRKATGEALDKVRETLSGNLGDLRKENEAKLEQMRVTVDEKLQGTLAERLGENFKLVSERLDTVHRGLGEMQALATGVGDLKRALTNIKSRGTWGEVQLGALLDDMFTPDQFSRQAKVRPRGSETVDYAVHMPGGDDGGLVLPIDCKFPQGEYDRLLAAQEAGDPAIVELAARSLEKAIRVQARSIRDKYIHPPHTTPFAILYLPTEGLFAEVIRRPGLTQSLATEFSVSVMGPTTLSISLNGLKLGFQTLAIQKNAGDIAKILGDAKKAFSDYGSALEAVDKKLDEAKNKVADVVVRHRVVHSKLKNVEVIDPPRAASLLPEPTAD